CTCIIPSIKIEHTFERTDGAIAEELQGSADRVVKAALMVVWRDMLLTQLARPENENDTSPFVKNVLPFIMEEICSLGNMGVGGLFCLIDHETFEANDGFESEDDIYMPSDGTDEDDSDDSDDMPSLMDIGSVDPPAKPNVGATEEPDHSDESDGEVPDLGPVSESTGLDSNSDDEENSEASSEGKQDEDVKAEEEDDDADIPSLTWDLDEEEVNRLQERPRLEKLVLDFVINFVKRHPAKDAFVIVTTSPLLFKRLDRLKKELLDHFLEMPHTSHTFSQVLSICVKEKATNHLTRLIAANPSLSARCPGDMQDAASYYISLTGSANRKQAAKIIMQAMETVIQDMVMEVEFGFRGVRKEAKRSEIMTILKTLKDDERKAAIKLWVDQVITPPPEALAKEVQPQPPVTNFNNPMEVLAAMTGLATTPP
ncbi:hypothetical protein FS837_008754, partial [Tulasnella sp. UAMH 9824]